MSNIDMCINHSTSHEYPGVHLFLVDNKESLGGGTLWYLMVARLVKGNSAFAISL